MLLFLVAEFCARTGNTRRRRLIFQAINVTASLWAMLHLPLLPALTITLTANLIQAYMGGAFAIVAAAYEKRLEEERQRSAQNLRAKAKKAEETPSYRRDEP